MNMTTDIREPAQRRASERFKPRSWRDKLQDFACRVAGWFEIAPRDLQPGVTPAARDWMTFAVYAPGKRRLALAGSFTQWKPLKLHRNRAGLWWTRTRLPAGRHEYMYVADGKTWIGDPYAREVSWTDLGPHAVLNVGTTPFTWHDTGYQLPYLRDQVLYEVHPVPL